MTPVWVLRDMRLDDLPQVLAIDRVSFPIAWSAKTYEFEINNRHTSHLAVIEMREDTPRAVVGVRHLIQRALGRTPQSGPIVGYGGCWLIAGEAHISTIAVHPDFRGRGLGELLLAVMLKRALQRGGEYSVLEVRESNATAQALYKKYEYATVGCRRGYYRDNNEDALLMEARPLDAAYNERLTARLTALRDRLPFVDQFSEPG